MPPAPHTTREFELATCVARWCFDVALPVGFFCLFLFFLEMGTDETPSLLGLVDAAVVVVVAGRISPNGDGRCCFLFFCCCGWLVVDEEEEGCIVVAIVVSGRET